FGRVIWSNTNRCCASPPASAATTVTRYCWNGIWPGRLAAPPRWPAWAFDGCTRTRSRCTASDRGRGSALDLGRASDGVELKLTTEQLQQLNTADQFSWASPYAQH